MIKKQKYPSYCCQKCGELIGWIGRFLPFHKCKNISLPRGRREWVGLTDEEMSEAMDYWSDDSRSAYGGAFAADGEYVDMVSTWRYIEAKLKEKNT